MISISRSTTTGLPDSGEGTLVFIVVSNFLFHRWGLRLRSVTSLKKKIPEGLLVKMDKFRKYVINVQRLLGEDCVMVNWDQTPTWKEPQTGTTFFCDMYTMYFDREGAGCPRWGRNCCQGQG